jgi:hypothetical protein
MIPDPVRARGAGATTTGAADGDHRPILPGAADSPALPRRPAGGRGGAGGASRGEGRDRVAPRRRELRHLKREILISATKQESWVALMEDDHLVELMLDRADQGRLVGDIYLGRVEAVLPGIQAAFVDIGTEKAGFLHVSDLVQDEDEDDDEEVATGNGGGNGRGGRNGRRRRGPGAPPDPGAAEEG